MATGLATDDSLLRAGGLTLFTIGLFATGALPGHMTALLFFLAAMLFSIAPAEVVFSGFTSTALWLVFGGLVLGVAVDHTGLGARIARTLAVYLRGGYVRVIAVLVLITVTISLFLPSSLGRIALMIPIVLAIADELGYAPGRKGRTGMVLATALGCFLPPFAILPANIPNLVMLGAAESLYGITMTYGGYLLLHFPVTGVGKALAIVAVVCFWFPDTGPERRTVSPKTAMTWPERRLALILGLAVALWITDFWHHISPAWIGLAAGLLSLLPGMKLLPLRAFEEKINHSAFFYVAGIVSLGAVVAHSGLGTWMGTGLIETIGLEPGAPIRNFFALVASGIGVGLATTLPGIPAVMTPLADLLSAATGLDRETVIMAQVISFSTVILPYQAPPLVLAIQLGGIRAVDMMRCTLTLAAITALVLMPLSYAWWRALDMVP
jgi:di/tricarboxylate transporter